MYWKVKYSFTSKERGTLLRGSERFNLFLITHIDYIAFRNVGHVSHDEADMASRITFSRRPRYESNGSFRLQIIDFEEFWLILLDHFIRKLLQLGIGVIDVGCRGLICVEVLDQDGDVDEVSV